MKKQAFVWTMLFSSFAGCDEGPVQNSEPEVEPPQQLISVLVSDTDPVIQYRPTSSHLAMSCVVAPCLDRLFVFLPGSGGSAQDHQRILESMASVGIKGIVLAYENGQSITSLCLEDDACYKQSRMDRLFGAVGSSYVSSVADGIENRLLKALQYLQWDEFIDNGTLRYDKINVGGFSQGAGMAALMGKQRLVNRVCMFSGPWDHTTGPISATWLGEYSLTPAAQFFGFTHQHDGLTNGVNYLDINWQALGMVAGSIEPYTNLTGQRFESSDEDIACAANYHACSVHDDVTPVNADSSARYQALWRYMCGG